MNDTTAPAVDIHAGHRIEHDLMPGFAMKVRAVKPCETNGARSEPHGQFLITDTEGNEDWLCAYDVHPAAVPGAGAGIEYSEARLPDDDPDSDPDA